MVINLSIDVGLHDLYSAMDVDFARESENDGPAPLHSQVRNLSFVTRLNEGLMQL